MPGERRRRPPVTAAATVLPLHRPATAKKMAGQRQEWQPDAFLYFDEVPELKQSVWWLGNAMAKLKLFIAAVPTGTEDPIPAADAGIDPAVVAQAEAELRRLIAYSGGAGELCRDANMQLELVGEGWLVGWDAREPVVDPNTGEEVEPAIPERWEIRSIDEVVITGTGKGTKYLVKDHPGDKGQPLIPDRDTIVRIYQRHPRWKAVADCAVRGVLTECEALMVLSRQIIAEANSKASAGILLVSNDLDPGPPAPLTEGGEQQPDVLMRDIQTALDGPVTDHRSPTANSPMLLRGPKEALTPDVFRHVTFDRKASEHLDERIEARVRRLARGLNLPLETVLGHQATTYANAEQVDEDQFDDHLQPRCVLVADSFTVGYLRPNLRDIDLIAGSPDIDRVMVWFDASDLIRQPDKAANAPQDLKDGLISEAAARAVRGWDESHAPTEEERMRRAGLTRGIMTGDLTLALLRLLMPDLEVLPIPKAEAQPVGSDGELLPTPEVEAGDQATEEEESSLGTRQFLARLLALQEAGQPLALTATAGGRRSQRTELGRALMELDRDLRTRILTAADAALGAAIDRAASRLRSKLGRQRSLFVNVANAELVATVPTDLLGQLGVDPEDLLAGAFDQLEAQFMAWGSAAQDTAVDAVYRIVSGIDTAERAALKLRQVDDLSEAWRWLETHLRTHAHDLLLDPNPAAADALGEVVRGLSIPPGMIRQAIAIAGGARLETSGVGGDAWTALTANGLPPGGIGTGDALIGLLGEHGAGTEGYRWVYGPALRKTPFEPHLALDGVEFTSFDDDVLANTSGFPDLSHYLPGDHGGCVCDFEPIIIIPTDQET